MPHRPPSDPLPQLFQAEWCPYSHAVRRRLTELGVDFVARQVPADRDDRDDMEREIGVRSIPTLVTAAGDVVCDRGPIVEYLDRTYAPRWDPAAHRRHADSDWPLWQRMW